MPWIDLAFVAVMLLSMLIGMLRGFVREAISVVTWILAFLLTLRYAPDFAASLRDTIHSEPTRTAVAYASVFFGILIAGALLGYLIGILIRSAGLRPTDRMLGFAFGILRGGLLIVAFIMVAGLTSLQEETWFQASMVVPKLKPAADSMQSLIPHEWFAYLPSSARKPDEVPVHKPEH